MYCACFIGKLILLVTGIEKFLLSLPIATFINCHEFSFRKYFLFAFRIVVVRNKIIIISSIVKSLLVCFYWGSRPCLHPKRPHPNKTSGQYLCMHRGAGGEVWNPGSGVGNYGTYNVIFRNFVGGGHPHLFYINLTPISLNNASPLLRPSPFVWFAKMYLFIYLFQFTRNIKHGR